MTAATYGAHPEPAGPGARPGSRILAWLLLPALAAIYAVETLVATLGAVEPSSPLVAWAIVVDLVVVVPVVYYFVAVRALGWPWPTVVPVTLAGLAISRALAPEAATLLGQFEWLLLPAELALLGMIVWRVRRGGRRLAAELRSDSSTNASARSEPLDAFRRAATEVVGDGASTRRLAEVLATELAVVYYAFVAWRRPLPAPDATCFENRKTSGYGVLVAGLLIATVAEIVPVHLLAHHFWSPIAAWILTGLAFYGGVWLVGDWQAMRRVPTRLDDDALRVRVGLRWRIDLPHGLVASARRVPPAEMRVRDALRAYPSGRASHCLELRQPVEASGMYGLRKQVTRVALLVDEPRRFEEALAARCPGLVQLSEV